VYPTPASGYSPGQVFHALPRNIGLFFDRRLPEILNLWRGPFISLTFAWGVGALVCGVWAADLAFGSRDWKNSLLKLGLWMTAFLMTESVMLVTDHYVGFASKYTTSIAQSMVFVFLLADTARIARSLLSRSPLAPFGFSATSPVYGASLLAFTIICAVNAHQQVATLIVLPATLETRFVGTRIADFVRVHHRVDEIEMIARPKPVLSESLLGGPLPWQWGEYIFQNLSSAGYMHYIARDVARDILHAEPSRVLTTVGDAKTDFTFPGRTLAADSAAYRVVIDTRELELFWRP
jgi:hypothetical protein